MYIAKNIEKIKHSKTKFNLLHHARKKKTILRFAWGHASWALGVQSFQHLLDTIKLTRQIDILRLNFKLKLVLYMVLKVYLKALTNILPNII